MKQSEILQKLKAGEFIPSEHALFRMQIRFISKNDIRACARTCSAFTWQDADETWLVEGRDCRGYEIHVAVAVENDVVIVTAYRPD